MTSEQLVPALMAALMGEGVTAAQVERAVSRVRGLRLGEDLSKLADGDSSLVRAFVFEQAMLLERCL